MKYLALVVVLDLAVAEVLPAHAEYEWSQSMFEECIMGFVRADNFPNGMPPDIPLRERNALPEFQWVFSHSGWTTNQLIEGLALAVTNNLSDEVLNDLERSRIPYNAVWKLSEINHPAVTNFFRRLNEIGEPRLGTTPILASFRYTNLEPEVLAYMRSLCLKTNIYERAAEGVMFDMLETLDTMPPELKPAATNRVAKYLYFSVRHTTRSMLYQDKRLAGLIPDYSNSVQRLEAMRYVSATATNQWQRVHAQMEADRLSALPAEHLNNLPWLLEE